MTALNGNDNQGRNARDTLQERFDALESTLSRLKDELTNARRRESPQDTRRQHMVQTRDLLERRGEVTVSDVRAALSVTTKTATRLLHAMNRDQAGHLFFEPSGHTERLVLVHPERVVIDRARARSSAN